ncbi:hypothetical protein F5883DRAFT_59656 [Diaporthe sp. PMI_573]|nr:hypothetical protein F5883DRAFT_59656 [Diaporthaceae sp. PMI_573]
MSIHLGMHLEELGTMGKGKGNQVRRRRRWSDSVWFFSSEGISGGIYLTLSSPLPSSPQSFAFGSGWTLTCPFFFSCLTIYHGH